MKVLCNAYLNHKRALLEAGELSPRTMQNYKEAAEVIVEQFSIEATQPLVARFSRDAILAAGFRDRLAKNSDAMDEC